MRIEGIEHKDEVLNLNEAADFMRISRRTLHSLIADGIGPPTLTIGRRRCTAGTDRDASRTRAAQAIR